MVQAARTIYLLAKTQDPHLIKRLTDLQIIDKTLAAIQTYSTTIISGAKSEGVARTGKIEEEAMSEMLLFYSRMIILEMSHDSMK